METIAVDLVVIGSTPGGIACAVRAAREGLRVLLTNYHNTLGGMISGGLGGWESICEDDARAPIYTEMRRAVFAYYRDTYGEDSPQYRAARYKGHGNGHFEPVVGKRFFTEMVQGEKNITLLTPYYPESATAQNGRIIETVFRKMDSDERVRVKASIFCDCTYEGDFLAAAGIPFRIGRESRSDYGESRAGRIFTLPQSNPQRDPYLHAIHSRLNISYSRTTTQLIPAPDSGEGDGLVQAINYRTILSTNPANRVLPRRPDDYDPSEYSKFEYKTRVREIPNDKVSWNRPQLIGLQNAYVEGNWATRRKVLKQFWRATVGLLYYLQNDAPLSDQERAEWRQYGFPIDEGIDQENPPCEIYLREGRRLKGRSILTESDALLAPGLPRSSLHADAIAFADWYIDCHACTAEKIGESRFEGTMTLFGECFPCQIPYGCIVAETFANVLAPVCLSATHVAFGAVRLEPAWMNLGESAGYAAALAMRQGVTPAEIKADDLVAHLARSRVSLIFFNDIGLSANEAWFPAIQYWGTKGFFPCFDARPHDKLTEKVAQQWLEIAGKVSRSDFDPNAAARTVMAMETGDLPLSASAWREMLQTRGFVRSSSPPPPPPPPPARRH
ncbi:FAD-dependent oxidoreductase [Opitutaceae bacterium TAV4]|nr:FAD-dependent oxidoreductase [Opitutaceae bacterium TAV4]